MEHIRVAKVENVSLLRRGVPFNGTLHVTHHHLIFRYARPPPLPGTSTPKASAQQEIWITYPIIGAAVRHPMSASGHAALRLRCRDFSFITFHFAKDKDCRDVFDSIRALSCQGNIEKLYAFYYTPPPFERVIDGWKIYDPLKEYERMGIGSRNKDWRLSKINNTYSFCPTYPAHLVVPATVSDNVLNYAGKYRSRARIPVLTYLHPINNCSITRSSQPLTGLKGNRSPQDEKLVAAIFSSSQASSFTGAGFFEDGASDLEGETCTTTNSTVKTSATASPKKQQVIYGAQQHNLIVDARPTVNAYAMQAVGLGSENMDNYRHCTKQYLGIDNIHVMRDSLSKIIEAIKDSDLTPLPPNRELLQRSGWLKHIGLLLDGTNIIVKQIAVEHSHVLIHCSDGWDRTSQLSALAQICLDPYFRTIEGFITLVEKDWLSFGHRFRDRSGFLSHEKWFTQVGGDTTSSNAGTGAGVGGGGGFGGMEAAFSQAKMFFQAQANGLANGRSSPGDGGVDSDAESQGLGSSSILVGEKKSKNPVSTGGATIKEISPVFHQFLDATYQILHQYPTRFEFNERFLRRLLYHLYSCQYGTFLYNNEKERLIDHKIPERTKSVWNYFLCDTRRNMWINEKYDRAEDNKDKGGWRVLFPAGVGSTRWWAESWGRTDEEMNGKVGALAALNPGDEGAEMSSGGGYKGVDEGNSASASTISPADSILTEDEDIENEGTNATNTEATGASAALVAAVSSMGSLALEGLANIGVGKESSRGTSPNPARKPKTPMEVEMM